MELATRTTWLSQHEVPDSKPHQGGLCPTCGKVTAPLLVVGAQRFAVCDDHKVAWHAFTSTVITCGTSEPDWKANRQKLAQYTIVEPAPCDLGTLDHWLRVSLGVRSYHPLANQAPPVSVRHVEVGRERLPDGRTLTRSVRVSDEPTPSIGVRGQPFVFKHGLGDAITFAHSIPLYIRRGHSITLACTPDKEIIFRAAGATVVPESGIILNHDYPYPDRIPPKMPTDWLPFNKLWHSISHPPMPDIGRDRSLWSEYCDVRLDLDPFIGVDVRESVDGFLAKLPQPLIVFHPQGCPPFERRSLRDDVASAVYRRLLTDTTGAIVALDWAGQQGVDSWTGEIPFVDHPRVISLRRDWKPLDVAEFYWLLKRADAFVGIDSGPAHFLRFTDTPGVVCWTRQLPPFGVPACCALPRPRTVNVIPYTVRPSDAAYRDAYNITESPGGELLDGDFIADQTLAFLKGGQPCQHG